MISCSSISKFVNEQLARAQKIDNAMKEHKYQMSAKELKSKLIAHWSSWHGMPATHEKDLFTTQVEFMTLKGIDKKRYEEIEKL